MSCSHVYTVRGEWRPLCIKCGVKCSHDLIRDVHFYPINHPMWRQPGLIFQSVVRCKQCNWDQLDNSPFAVCECKRLSNQIEHFYDYGLD